MNDLEPAWDGRSGTAGGAAFGRALAALLAERDVAIVSGHGSREKTVALSGIDTDEIERRLASASGAGKERA